MNHAGSTQPQIPRLNVGGPQRTIPANAQVLKESSVPGNGNAEIGHPEQALRSARSTPSDKALEEEMHVSITHDIKSHSPMADSDTVEQDQLIVELKYNKSRSSTPPSAHPTFGPINFDELIQIAASAKKPKPSNPDTIVKEEPKATRALPSPDPSTSIASSSDPKIKKEKKDSVGDGSLTAQQPLGELANALVQVHFIKDEVKSEEFQHTEPKKEPQGDEEMHVEFHQGDDVMRVPENAEGPSRSSEVGARQSTTSEDPHEQSPAKVVTGDQAHDHALPRNDDGTNVSELSDSTFVPEDSEVNDFLSIEDLQQRLHPGEGSHKEFSATSAQEPQRKQDLQTDERDAGASDSDEYEFDEEEEHEFEDEAEEGFDDEPRGLSAGLSNSGFGVQDLWNQRHQGFTDPVQFSRSPPINRHMQPSSQNMVGDQTLSFEAPVSRHVSQEPTTAYDQNGFSAELHRQKELRMKIAQAKEAQKQYKVVQPTLGSFDFVQNPMGGSFQIPLGPLSYQRAPPSVYQQQASYTPNNVASQYPIQLPMSYDQMPSKSSHMQYASQGYSMPARSSMPPSLNNQMSSAFPTQEMSNMGWQHFDGQDNDDEHDCGNEGGASDDDEPLRTRLKRHPSVMSQDTVIESPSYPYRQVQEHDSDMEITGSRPKPEAIKSKIENPVRMARPLPVPRSIPIVSKNQPSDGAEIDWSLPEYEVQVQPYDKKEDLPSAKVSIPGLVREEIILSPDHTEQETHLLVNLFIPGQQAREIQDPEPAQAVLNFHTIATMVIEAYVQFEIGDTFGMGRGHFHQDHDRGEEEYDRMRDAKDADVDEIFFEVVDRWRAGIESKKQALSLIRGAQEFCDVALDLIYYIKEHGLLKPEPKAKKERSDKGVKRGAQKKTAKEGTEQAAGKGKGKRKAKEGGAVKKQGTKRGTTTKPNEVQPRKKAKTSSLQVKKRTKPATPGVTVVRRK